MQRTRITVKLLVGVAVTTLSGCVSVAPQPDVPSRPGASRPAQDLAPQIVRPPVHDSLGAVPAAEPSTSASAPARGAPPDTRRAAPRAPQQRKHTGAARPRPRQVPPPVTAPVPDLPTPVTEKDVCALGRGYGHWPAGSPQSRICENTYGR
ncbi:hypothetical protein [Streptomyces atratus]|uniref:hypothetical protein n=1 Tax=Streptomyces atratus TaxID=1893 RepID=UPI002AC321E7|nr:hypothetical protein [Streptomyces atratus]WPW27545.1 hypothetical protein P6B95_09230 [Streptomyces atratus]